MKKIIFLLMALMPCLAFGQKANIEFTETSFNFGTISEAAGKAVHVFNFKNTGNAPLILTNVRAGCGCTTPEWDRQPIAPGASGNIKVSFDPRNRPGSFVKSITVNSNASTPVVSLTIRGNVSRKPASPFDNYKYQVGVIKINSNNLNLGNIKNTQQIERNLTFINTGSQPASLSAVSSSPAISLTVTPGSVKKGETGKILIKYDASKTNEWGFVTDHIDILVNHQDKGSINLVGNISEDFSSYQGNFEKAPVITLSETEANVEHVAKNSTNTHEFYIQNTGKSELIIHKVKASDSETSVNIPKLTLKPGKKVKANITYKTKNTPRITKIIQFITNDPQHPTVNYKLTAHVN